MIDENILSQIFNREIKTWSNKNIPSVETSKNTFFKSFENKHQNDIGIIFFPGPSIKKITIEKCLEVAKVESKADKVSTELKKTIFSNTENGLATKVHLKYFVEIMDEVANLSEDVADRLIISSSKN